MRKEVFTPKPQETQPFKSLRHNAREAAEYLSGIPYVPEYEPEVVPRSPGRGASGESSN